MKLANISSLLSKKHSLIIQLVSSTFLVTTFFIFRTTEQKDIVKTRSNIEVLLRSETRVSNSYAMAKTLVDLEYVGIFNCARLIELTEPARIFYSTLINQKCNGIFNQKDTFVLTGLNGTSYKMTYIKGINFYAIFLEGLVYIIIMALGIYLPGHYENKVQRESIKAALLRSENSQLHKLTSKTSHDVASPLSAIRLISSLLKNVDPEIKNVLNKAIDRTQVILDDLKRKNVSILEFDIERSLDSITSEKIVLWNTNPFKLINSAKGGLVLGNENDFNRILSNIFNNAYEAKSVNRELEIQVSVFCEKENIVIEIKDNCIGIPQEIMNKIGNEGFTYGKENFGSGLGLYNAICDINSWGGSLKVVSKVNVGTSIQIKLKKTQEG